MRDLRIAIKLPIFIGAVALLSVSITGVLSYRSADDALYDEATHTLQALREGRATAISDYLGSIREDLQLVANNPHTADALKRLSGGYGAIGDTAAETLQTLYINDNPHPPGKKDMLDDAGDGSTYSQAHNDLHAWFRALQQQRGYYDIFLLNAKGDLIYTVFKEADYATNVLTGKWKDSGLGTAFRGVQKADKESSVVLTDFAPYAPSAGAPASFIATPVHDGNGTFIGALAYQMPIDRINAVMQISAGLGDTGEAYLVGEDLLMRSDSRLVADGTLLKTKVDTPSVRAALAGETGVMEVQDYRGSTVVSAYAPLSFEGIKLGVIAEMDREEVQRPVIALRNMLTLGGAIILVIVGAIGVFFARGITNPLRHMTTAMNTLAKGDLDTAIPAQGRTDELGDMAQAMSIFKDNAYEVERMKAEEEASKARAAEERRAGMMALADNFEEHISAIVTAVSAASEQMQSQATSLAAVAEEAQRQASAVAAATEESSGNVQTVASGAEELSSSINEISRQVSQSADVTRDTAQKAGTAHNIVQGLESAATRIGDAVTLINDIASQTNLLALNATIEAARAGDAGKGFAVVANEVKNLASQTARATEEISRQINDVQSETNSAVTAIDDIVKAVEQMNEIASGIASAVEEQNAATQEIARNTQQAAAGTQEVSANIQGVTEAAHETGSASSQVLAAAEALSVQADRLRTEVAQFIGRIREG